jgi:hypothetical protein
MVLSNYPNYIDLSYIKIIIKDYGKMGTAFKRNC